MDTMQEYKIYFTTSKLVGSEYTFTENDKFFEMIDGLVSRGNIHTTVKCTSASSTLICFTLHSKGTVIVPCDRCLADVELRIDTEDELMVRIGDEYLDDGEYVTVPESDGYVDLSQFIYEFIVLSMPIQRLHEPGMCDVEMIARLQEHQAARSSMDNADGLDSTTDDASAGDGPVDERWNALKELLNK